MHTGEDTVPKSEMSNALGNSLRVTSHGQMLHVKSSGHKVEGSMTCMNTMRWSKGISLSQVYALRPAHREPMSGPLGAALG
jgi:hypothetical protein